MSDAPNTLQEVWTRLDGLRLLYRFSTAAASTGAPPIIHLHGFAISGRYLLPTAERLAPYYPTYVPDLPGFGRSEHPRHPLGIPELADAVARFMDHVGVDRAILLGNSLGCPIIGSFVHAHPDRIERTIWCSPAGGIHNRPFIKGAAQMAIVGLREPPQMLPIALGDYAHYGVIQSIDMFRSLIHYPTLERLAEIRIPTLAILGSRDTLVSVERARTVAGELPHVTVVVLEGAAHAMNFSHPDQLANVVHAWLDGRPIVGDPTAKGTVRLLYSPAS